MSAQGLIPPGTRVWLRLDAAPCHHKTVAQAVHTSVSRGLHAASVSGIVVQLTTCVQQVYSRMLRCVCSHQRLQ